MVTIGAKRYLWGPTEDQLLAQENYDAGQDQTARLLWGLADHLGSPRTVGDCPNFAQSSEQNGTVPLRRRFWIKLYVEFLPGDELLETEDETVLIVHVALDSFGNILSGDATEVRYIYTAQEYDAETGFYYYDRRYVDPSTGRFISEDFIWDGYNKHAYVGNAPTMFVDPSGREGQKVIDLGKQDLNEKVTDQVSEPITIISGDLIVTLTIDANLNGNVLGRGGWPSKIPGKGGHNNPLHTSGVIVNSCG